MQAMDMWINNMEEMFASNLTDIHFQTDRWAELASRNKFQTELIYHSVSFAGFSNKPNKENQLNMMFNTFISSARPILFGYGGLINRPSILFGPEALAFSSLTVQSDRQNRLNDTSSMDDELKMIYAELAKQPNLSNHRSDILIDPLTEDYLHTFEGMRKVVGGNGSGTPDGLAPVGMFAYDFFTEDLATMVSSESTVNERLAAAAFTFVKPLKVADTGHDLLKGGEKAKNLDKGTGKASPDVIRKVDNNILDRMESVGGHTLERHVGKSNDELIKRAIQENVEAATSFTDKSTAIKVIQENLRKNADDIAEWLNESDTGRKMFDVSHKNPIGKGALEDKKQVIYDLTNSRVILIRDTTNELGFRILTGFPVIK
ncbi:hypothetical protein KD050_12400 [Psychrobacillus sp. INOP01]|nr:hypothetical protein KD050_12400 [Psychrobacillus sp. INOP01]